MSTRFTAAVLMAATMLVGSTSATAADFWGLKEGSPELKTAGPLTFGPEGVLFIGDPKSAAVFAIDTGDRSGDPKSAEINIQALNQKSAAALKSEVSQTQINDLAVNPLSGGVYLSVTAAGKPAILRAGADGKITQLPLEDIRFSKAELPLAPEDKEVQRGRRRSNPRDESITDLAFIDGKLLVSGLSSADAPSSVRELGFPFSEDNTATSLEIYHGAHGKVEDYAAIRTFVPFNINGQPHVLAGFTCTPLVKFPVQGLKPDAKLRGTTVAELGNRNRPLDMIVYQQGGKDYLLMANSNRGVMKISTEDIERQDGINERISDTAGQKYETIGKLEGVVQLDKLNNEQAVILVQNKSGDQDLKTIPLP